MSSGEEDLMDHNPPILPPQAEQKALGSANTSTGSPTYASDEKTQILRSLQDYCLVFAVHLSVTVKHLIFIYFLCNHYFYPQNHM